jgi:Multiubiquitin
MNLAGEFMNESAQGGEVKQITIIVNGRQKTVAEKEMTFDEIVTIAYGAPDHENNIYTVTYFRNEKEKHEGSLVRGQSIHVKDGMIFTVVRTTRS